MALQYYGGVAAAAIPTNNKDLILLTPSDGIGETHAISRPSSLKLAIAQAYRLFSIDEKYYEITLKSSLINQEGSEVFVNCNNAVWGYEGPNSSYNRLSLYGGLRTFKVVKTAKLVPVVAPKGKKRKAKAKAKKDSPRRRRKVKKEKKDDEEVKDQKVIVITSDDDEDEDEDDDDDSDDDSDEEEDTDDSEVTMTSRRRSQSTSTSKRRRRTSSRTRDSDSFIDLAPRAPRTSKIILPLSGDTKLQRSFGVRPTTLIGTLYNAVAKELGLVKENFTLALQENEEEEGVAGTSKLAELIEIAKDEKTLKGNLAGLVEGKRTDEEWRRFEIYVCKVEIEID